LFVCCCLLFLIIKISVLTTEMKSKCCSQLIGVLTKEQESSLFYSTFVLSCLLGYRGLPSVNTAQRGLPRKSAVFTLACAPWVTQCKQESVRKREQKRLFISSYGYNSNYATEVNLIWIINKKKNRNFRKGVVINRIKIRIVLY